MGEGRTGEPQANQQRLTVAQAAKVLGITEGAVRSRIKRGTLPNTKEGGTVYVLLGGGTSQANQTPNAGVPGDQSALIEALRDQVEDLRRERDEWREQARVVDRLLSAALERIPPQLESPRDEREQPQTVEEHPDRAEPSSASGGPHEDIERPQQRSGWLAPVDKLPWWHYVLGLVLVGVVALSFPWFFFEDLLRTGVVAGGVFGLWVGLRRSQLRFRTQVIPLGVLVGLAIVLGNRSTYPVLDWVRIYETKPAPYFVSYMLGYTSSTFFAGWLLFVSGALIGSAWQRRRAERLSRSTPGTPVSGADLASAASRTAGWTPRQQAILGFVGTIIAALISFMGTIFSVILASGG